MESDGEQEGDGTMTGADVIIGLAVLANAWFLLALAGIGGGW